MTKPQVKGTNNYIIAPLGRDLAGQYIMEVTEIDEEAGVGGTSVWAFDDLTSALSAIAEDDFECAHIEILSIPCKVDMPAY